jgi:beta-phosphoglucomutase family hydrolase
MGSASMHSFLRPIRSASRPTYRAPAVSRPPMAPTIVGNAPDGHERDFPPRNGKTRSMLDLPAGITTCLFDLDGVLTQTAKIHARAWKEMFDDFLREWAERHGAPFEPFDRPTDYDEYVDGKPRLDGVHSFLQSRGIDLPMGSPSDPPDADTVHGLGTRKNDLVLQLIQQQGAEPYEGSVRFVEEVRDAGLRRAVVSSSTNCRDVLVAAGIEQYFEAHIDGTFAEREGLAGKPAPDTFLAAARVLDAEPAQAAVFEDALAGVEAGHAGAFGWVVGVDRTGQAEALKARGADVVVRDLDQLLVRA